MNKKNKNTIKWLYDIPGKKRYYILILIIVQAIHGGSGVLYALLLRNIVDCAVDKDQSGFWMNVVFIVLLVISQLAMRAVLRWLGELSRADLENVFKMRMLKNLLKKDYASVSAVHSGEWLNRLTNDTVVVANAYTEILPGISGMLVKMISAMIMIIILDPWFACIIIPGGIIMAFFTYAFRKILKKLHKNMQEKDGALRIFFQERLGSMMMIRSFAAEKQTEAEANTKADEHKNARMRKNRFSNLCNVGFGTAINGMYLFGVCYCGWGIMTGTVSYGTLTAVTQLISQIQSPFANITGYLPRIYAMTASAERLMEIESFDNDCEKDPLSVSDIKTIYDNELSSIVLKDVCFTYYPPSDKLSELSKEEMPTVMDHITLDVRKGEYTAFTGHSGCGKSTVLKLLMCIYRPDSGKCCYLTPTGEEKELTPEMHRLFAYVPQGNRLMSGTIREIVSFADPDDCNNNERIEKALQIACAYDFVKELDNGIDTVLGERGTGLSEGQMQRIAVARAVYSDSPIIILDEATSSLDTKTEGELLENLRKMTDKTVLIVTHRPAALEICDRILKFTENGIMEKEK